jgi:hypothetical protein
MNLVWDQCTRAVLLSGCREMMALYPAFVLLPGRVEVCDPPWLVTCTSVAQFPTAGSNSTNYLWSSFSLSSLVLCGTSWDHFPSHLLTLESCSLGLLLGDLSLTGHSCSRLLSDLKAFWLKAVKNDEDPSLWGSGLASLSYYGYKALCSHF